MAGQTEQTPQRGGGALLRRLDQLCVAVIVAGSLLAMFVMWFVQGGHRGHLVDVEHAAPRPVEFRIDINQADWPEWTLLPGVGELLARRIVESRRRDGPFLSHDDLLRVKGIGPKTLHNIRPFLLPLDRPHHLDQQRPR